MTRTSRVSDLVRISVLVSTISALVLMSCIGCAPTHDSGGVNGNGVLDRDPLEVSCELALVRLESLIASRSADKSFAPAVLIEAKELHRMGTELYLERQYALALELIEEGILLLEEESGKK
ncbi:MAG: hypothetical protein JSW58_00755 [Candidatus Latescibacterota bacterium]|nr:MAG: hypothetical protein JSW58_00755 [Candidatus Latescibacterota bacterium]